MNDHKPDETGSAWTTVRQLGIGACIVFLVVVFNAVLVAFGVYDASDPHEYDRLIRTLGTPDSLSDDVTLVTIDNDDYRTKFNNKSPLDKQTIADIVHAIVEFEPAVLGIAVDTGDWQPPIPRFTPKQVRLVWAVTRNAQGAYALDWAQNLASNEPPICTAVPLFYPDDDGTIRKQVESVTNRDRRRPSFPVALRRSLDSPQWHAEECARDMPASVHGGGSYIQFTGKHHQFTRFSATDVLAAAGPYGHKPQHMTAALRNSVVILGGSYDAARDRHPTPVGDKDGVEILAHAFESLDRPVGSSLVVTALVEFGIACAALIAFHFIKMPRLAKAVLATLVPFVLAIPVRYILFEYGSFASVVVSFLGIPFHQYAHELYEFRHEKRDATTHGDANKAAKAERDAHAGHVDRDRPGTGDRVRVGSARGPASGVRGRRR